MRGDQKKLWVVAGIFVFALAFWLGIRKYVPAPGASPSPSSTATVKKTPAPSTGGLSQSYNQALVTYANRRFQFDKYCQAQPSRMSISRGQAIMLDNRSGDARTFSVGDVFFTLSGYGWRIMTPTAATYPATLYVDCGSAQNVGTIIVQ